MEAIQFLYQSSGWSGPSSYTIYGLYNSDPNGGHQRLTAVDTIYQSNDYDVPVTITSTTYQYTTVTRHIDLYFTDMYPNSPQGGKQENAVWNSTTFKKPTYHFSNSETELGEWEYDSGDSYWDSYSAPDYSNIYYYPSESYISGETPTPNSGDNYITIIYNHNYPHQLFSLLSWLICYDIYSNEVKRNKIATCKKALSRYDNAFIFSLGATSKRAGETVTSYDRCDDYSTSNRTV